MRTHNFRKPIQGSLTKKNACSRLTMLSCAVKISKRLEGSFRAKAVNKELGLPRKEYVILCATNKDRSSNAVGKSSEVILLRFQELCVGALLVESLETLLDSPSH
jgi:hypothetical protein